MKKLNMKMLLLVILQLLIVNGINGDSEECVGRAGDEVVLPCPVNTADCGDFHSLKWYRGSSRVYVFSPVAQFSNAEGALVDRCFDVSQSSLGAACSRGYLDLTDTNANLRITPVEIKDEGDYRCEITYLDVSKDCLSVHFTKLRTIAAPASVSLFMSNNLEEDLSGQVLGPYASGSSVEFSCKSGGGKPAPSVAWRFGDEDLEGETTVYEDVITGYITVTSVVVVELQSEQSGAELNCLVLNEALEEPITANIQIDVNVPVKSVSIDTETVGNENEELILICTALGGRPMPTISWSTPENVLFETVEEYKTLEDETFELVSTLTFTPSAEENGETVTCLAINNVMEEPLEDETILNIQYSPRVTMEDENKTVTAGQEFSIACLIDANPMNFSNIQWFHNENVINVDDERFNSETSDIVSLSIYHIAPGDAGQYKCSVENEVGRALSTNYIDVDVLYPPVVKISIEPEGPVSEEDHVNVTLHCDLVDANPLELTRVSWYLNGDLLREIPDYECEEVRENGSGEMLSDNIFVQKEITEYLYESEDESSGAANYLCDIDPTELILQDVTRDLQGMFTCAGSNLAGEGKASEPQELNIYYLPGQAKLVQNEEFPLKGTSTVLTCALQDLGNPEASDFLWQKGETILEERTQNYTLGDLRVGSEDNISCSAMNEVGYGDSSTLNFEVFVPPTFITKLSERSNFLSDSKHLSLLCQVECVPLCKIKWLRNEEIINENDSKYTITEEIIEEDLNTNQFKLVSSKLFWNLENFPTEKLDHNELNFTISCEAAETDVGLAISSTTHITVEYAPENVDISSQFIAVEEGNFLEDVFCIADASPEPIFSWKFENKAIDNGQVLKLPEAISKEKSGDFFCHVQNIHGEEIIKVTVDVLYRPECSVTYTLMEEEIVLLCTANGNPNELRFWWEKQNNTFEGQATGDKLQSEVRLKLINESLGSYYCHVNNSIGESEACMLDLTEQMLTKGLSEEELIFIVSLLAGLLVLLLIISILVCVYYGKEDKGGKGKQSLKMRNLKLIEIIQVFQIIIFFATGGPSHSQFKYKAILPK